MASPQVSICIPAYNAARWIGEALTSALGQTWQDLEVVIVDDASTDETAEIVRGCGDRRVRLWANAHNAGQSATSNRALRLSRGPFIKFLHADDTLEPECVAEFVELFERHETLGMAFSRRQVVLEDPSDPAARAWQRRSAELHEPLGRLDELNAGPELFERHLADGFSSNWVGEPSCVMVRRTALLRSKTFNLRIRQMVDVDLWVRLMADSDVGFIDRELSTYRFTSRGVTARVVPVSANWLDKLWLLEGLATLPDVWRRHPQLATLRRAEVRGRLGELGVRGRERRLQRDQVRDMAAYLGHRARSVVGADSPVLGTL